MHDRLLGWRHLIHQTRFDELIKIVDVQKGESIVDIGCSRGHFVYEFRERGAKACGVDINPSHFTDNKEGLEFIEGSIFDIPLPDQSMDKVFISEVLVALPGNPVDALREVFRILKPGGKFVLCNSNGYKIIDLIFENSKWRFGFIRGLLSILTGYRKSAMPELKEKILRYLGVDDQYERNFTVNETVSMLESAGFTEVSFSYQFRKSVSDLMGLLLVLRVGLGLTRYHKALYWDFWCLFPLFRFLEKRDTRPGSGVVFTAIKSVIEG